MEKINSTVWIVVKCSKLGIYLLKYKNLKTNFLLKEWISGCSKPMVDLNFLTLSNWWIIVLKRNKNSANSKWGGINAWCTHQNNVKNYAIYRCLQLMHCKAQKLCQYNADLKEELKGDWLIDGLNMYLIHKMLLYITYETKNINTKGLMSTTCKNKFCLIFSHQIYWKWGWGMSDLDLSLKHLNIKTKIDI